MKTTKTPRHQVLFTLFGILAAFALFAGNAPAQATNNAPTTPMDVLNNIGAYFTGFNTNLTWTNTPISLWTGANYQSGVNTSAELGGSYDLWRPTANAAIAPEIVVRNAGVAGTFVSGQAGAGLSVFHYDLKVTGYLDAGDNLPLKSAFIELGARFQKKLTTSTHAGIGLSVTHLFSGPNQNAPGVTAFLGWDF